MNSGQEVAPVIGNEDLSCPTCGHEGGHEASGCNWWTCPACRCLWSEDERNDDALPWKCYHCGEVFATHEAAHAHFGASQIAEPGCQIDLKKYRDMEELMRRYNAEDSQLHRELLSQATAHRAALQAAEEKGYARGLEEAKAQRA